MLQYNPCTVVIYNIHRQVEQVDIHISGTITFKCNNQEQQTAHIHFLSLTSSTTYYCVVTSGSCGTVTSNNITITVYGNLTSGVIGNSQTICYNTVPAQLSFTTSPTGGTGIYSISGSKQQIR